ncbi:MAG TPA: lysoplasmalogenase [Acidimicrobiales bacterium]|nr:lysoplasmalogenase [Acidimicrobiales bacterium]
MTAAASGWLALAVVAALADWFAVYHRRRELELVAKPLTMVALVLATLAADPGEPGARAWFVTAQVLSLVGDVALMLRTRPLFLAGLGSFLVAHVAYVVGLAGFGLDPLGLGVGLALVVVGLAAVGGPLLAGVRRTEMELVPPVTAYLVVISAMVVTAVGTGEPLAIAGAALFYASDALLGWNRFVRPRPRGDVPVMVTYHLAQILLFLALVAG